MTRKSKLINNINNQIDENESEYEYYDESNEEEEEEEERKASDFEEQTSQ